MAEAPKENAAGPENVAAKLAILIALLAALSFVLVHFNIVSCGFYSSFGCDVYYSLTAGGKPKILIVHGDEGMGDPEFLFNTLRGPKFSARVEIKEMELVSLPVLNEYQLVVVEKAAEMKTSELKMFQEYVARGGKLVWIGNAGTRAQESEADENYFLREKDREVSGSEEFISPWARREGNRQVSFDLLLGVNFKANYCDIEECPKSGEAELTGFFDFIDQDERIVYGLSQSLPFYGNFSIVELNSDAFQKNLAFLDYGTDLIGEPHPLGGEYFWLKGGKLDFGKSFPIIVSSGVGNRVLYYAFPPEFFVSDSMPVDKKTGEKTRYWALIENMYYGMLYK